MIQLLRLAPSKLAITCIKSSSQEPGLVAITCLLPGHTKFSTCPVWGVRRARARLEQVQELQEKDLGAHKWQEYGMEGRRKNEDTDNLRMTSFGSMRVDSDNRPRWRGEEEQGAQQEVEREGGGMVRPHKEQPEGYLGALFEEEDQVVRNPYTKFRPFSTGAEDKDFKAEKQHFAFGAVIENKTLVPPLENTPPPSELHSLKPSRHKDKDDLNYMDKQLFGSAFSSFSPSEAAKVREVSVDPSCDLAREVAREEGLNLVDQEYFASSSLNPTEESSREAPQLAEEVKDLGFIDEQFFAPTNVSNYAEEKSELLNTKSGSSQQFEEVSSQKTEADTVESRFTKWFEADLDGDLAGPVKLNSDEELKASMKERRKERQKSESKGSLESLANKNPKAQEQELTLPPLKKKKKDKKAEKGSGQALDYVRKLRKAEEEGTTSPFLKHPKQTFDTNLQDRLLQATANLQPNLR